MSKLKKIFNPTIEDKYLKFITNFRKNIPLRYNQIKLADELLNDSLDHYVSISNRSDGKSFNYCHFFLELALEFNIKFTFVVRHHTVQVSGMKLFQKIIDEKKKNPQDFQFMRTDFYIVLIYRDKELGIITDLNKATDLKYQSNYLENFPIIIYDEFLALEGDYLIDEWDKLKTIYSSIDRKSEVPLIKFPKVFYLGNAVNFSSPILVNLDLFNILEKQQMNTVSSYDNIVVELNRNDNANEQRNLRAFREFDDELTKAEFEINKHNIATNNDRLRINKNPNYIYIKLRENFMKITYNEKTYESILSIISYHKTYDFNILLKDNKETSKYLDESFYDDEHDRKYNKDIFLFDNMYSKDNIIDIYSNLKDLRINKIIKYHVTVNNLDNFEMKEKIYKENYIENTKKGLVERFLNDYV